MKTESPDWLTLELAVPASRVEAAERWLFEAGALSVTLQDGADHPLHEPAPGELPIWPQVIVQALFPGATQRADLSDGLLAAGLVDSATALDFFDLAERDWQRAWMDQYRPMRFGHGLWICPSHIEPDPGWPLVVRLDPGLAFGSGTHPTTALCLEWIDGLDLQGQAVIDYGCGSGVLAIAAALKGAKPVIGVDYDPQAVTATLDNAERNQVADRVRALTPQAFGDLPSKRRQAGLVVANILAQPLIDLAPQLSACLAENGQLVLSGILPEQAESVATAYRALDPNPERQDRDGWVRLVLKKSGRSSAG